MSFNSYMDTGNSIYNKKSVTNSMAYQSDFSSIPFGLYDDGIFTDDLSYPMVLPDSSAYLDYLELLILMMNNQVNQQKFIKYFDDTYKMAPGKDIKQVYNAELSERLAKTAEANARRTNTIGWCARGSNNALEQANLAKGETRAGSACMVANKLYNHENFEKINVSRGDLKNLPAGCIIVWQASSGHPHGHMAITLGNGNEASDHIQKINANRQANFSVFVPVRKNYVG